MHAAYDTARPGATWPGGSGIEKKVRAETHTPQSLCERRCAVPRCTTIASSWKSIDTGGWCHVVRPTLLLSEKKLSK